MIPLSNDSSRIRSAADVISQGSGSKVTRPNDRLQLGRIDKSKKQKNEPMLGKNRRKRGDKTRYYPCENYPSQ